MALLPRISFTTWLVAGVVACGGNVTPQPSRPVKITFDGAPADVSADEGQLAVPFQLVDRNGRQVPGMKPTATASPRGKVEIIREIEAGYEVVLTELFSAGPTSLSVRWDQLAGTHSIEIKPGAADPASPFTVAPAAVPADGTSIATATIKPKDERGNLLGPGRAVEIAATGGAKVSTVVDAGDGSYAATVSHSVVEQVTLIGKVDGLILGTQPAVSFTSTVVSVKAQAQATVEAGRTIDVVAIVKIGEALASGRQVSFELSAGANAALGATRELSPGTYAASFYDEKAESVTVTARDATSAASDSVAIKVVAAPAASLTLRVAATQVSADVGTQGLTARIADRWANPIAGARPTFSSTQGALGIVTDNGDGSYTASISGLRRAETVTAEVKLGLLASSEQFTVEPGAVSAGQSTVIVPTRTNCAGCWKEMPSRSTTLTPIAAESRSRSTT